MVDTAVSKLAQELHRRSRSYKHVRTRSLIVGGLCGNKTTHAVCFCLRGGERVTHTPAQLLTAQYVVVFRVVACSVHQQQQ